MLQIMKEKCVLIHIRLMGVGKNSKQEYTIPLKKISVFQECKDGKRIIHLDNRNVRQK